MKGENARGQKRNGTKLCALRFILFVVSDVPLFQMSHVIVSQYPL